MRKFVINSALFLFPIGLLIAWTIKNYNVNQGDLARISYLNIEYDYSNIFPGEYTKSKEVTYNDAPKVRKKKWKFFTIGDSFTQQPNVGYVNKLTAKYPNDVLSYRHAYQFEGDVFSTIYGLANSDYFDSVKVEYVILQHVERYIVYRAYNPNKTIKIHFSDIQRQQKKNELRQQTTSKSTKKEPFPTDRFIKFPLNNIMYHFKNAGHNQQVYREPLRKQLFSTNTSDLLFFKEDFELLNFTNEEQHIVNLNNNLNEIACLLNKKGIQLIVLVAPDKFDLYHPYIKDTSNYPKPNFFEQIASLEKNYLFIQSRSLLREALHKGKKDVYLYDDTHWSPWGSEIIATEISRITKQHQSLNPNCK